MAYIRDKFEPKPVDSPEVKGVSMQVLIGKDEQSPTCIMRRFRVEAGGYSPHHQHNYEHVVYVLSGKGTLLASEKEREITSGNSLIVQPNEIHQFRADQGETLEFLCIIPKM